MIEITCFEWTPEQKQYYEWKKYESIGMSLFFCYSRWKMQPIISDRRSIQIARMVWISMWNGVQQQKKILWHVQVHHFVYFALSFWLFFLILDRYVSRISKIIKLIFSFFYSIAVNGKIAQKKIEKVKWTNAVVNDEHINVHSARVFSYFHQSVVCSEWKLRLQRPSC